MKKSFILVMVITLFLLASCDGEASIDDSYYSTQASYILVTEKGHSDDFKEYWIKAYDPNSQVIEEAFKIVVKEEMVWNLIVEGKEYFSSYGKEGNKPWILQQIKYPG